MDAIESLTSVAVVEACRAGYEYRVGSRTVAEPDEVDKALFGAWPPRQGSTSGSTQRPRHPGG